MAADAPHADLPLETVTVRLDGQDYTLRHKSYPAPLALDLARASGARDTPYHALLSYYAAFAKIADWDDVAPFLRLANGDPGTPPQDEAAQIAAARQIFSSEILIYGEIALAEYRIYTYRYAVSSLKRLSGLPVRDFGGEYYVVQDLILNNALAHRLSALRWDVERLKAEHPAPGAQ